MGMLKDIKDLIRVIRSDELKELKRRADALPKTSVFNSIKLASQIMTQASEMQAAMASQDGLTQNPMANLGEMAQGTLGNATVRGTADTGQRLGDAPIMDVELEIRVSNEAPYTLVHRQAIAPTAMGEWHVGKVWPVTVDLNDRSKVIVG